MTTSASRGVDALDPLPDATLQKQDAAYLAQHGINELFAQLLSKIVQTKPQDPIQFLIDSLEYTTDVAEQDSATGLSQQRKAKLIDVFRCMDQEGHGKISFANLQRHASKYGCTPLGAAELQSMFSDFQPSSSDNLISLHEFLVYFSKASRSITNTAFDAMVKELMA